MHTHSHTRTHASAKSNRLKKEKAQKRVLMPNLLPSPTTTPSNTQNAAKTPENAKILPLVPFITPTTHPNTLTRTHTHPSPLSLLPPSPLNPFSLSFFFSYPTKRFIPIYLNNEYCERKMTLPATMTGEKQKDQPFFFFLRPSFFAEPRRPKLGATKPGQAPPANADLTLCLACSKKGDTHALRVRTPCGE